MVWTSEDVLLSPGLGLSVLQGPTVGFIAVIKCQWQQNLCLHQMQSIVNVRFYIYCI